jgi:poly-gamma-glutamate synthesis protein (capsule biosynthesis protein)
MIKLTFTGDILCDLEEIPTYKNQEDEYDFSEKFKDCKEYFSRSDYIVANLETPVANAEYCNKRFLFNSPIALIKAIKEAGVSLVTTANNHCLDRGIKGLEETIANIDGIGLKHIGTNSTPPPPQSHSLYTTGIIEKVKDSKIGFLSYTYGTNAFNNKVYLNKNELWKVNLFQDQELHNPLYRRLYNAHIGRFWRRAINKIARLVIRRNMYCPVYERKEARHYFDHKMKDDIQHLRKSGAEYIVMCLHAGGQFNAKPLQQTRKLINHIVGYGVDAVICNHEHVVHKCEITGDTIKVFALGDFTSLLGVQREPYDTMAEYSILFNIYLDREDVSIKVKQCTFTIVKKVSMGPGKIRTVLLKELIETCEDNTEKQKLMADNAAMFNKFKGTSETNIPLQLEYVIA